MPQMKPMIWLVMMILSILMIMSTIIMNFFSTMDLTPQFKLNPPKSIKWKW